MILRTLIHCLEVKVLLQKQMTQDFSHFNLQAQKNSKHWKKNLVEKTKMLKFCFISLVNLHTKYIKKFASHFCFVDEKKKEWTQKAVTFHNVVGPCVFHLCVDFHLLSTSDTTLNGVDTHTVASSPTVMIKCCICSSPHLLTRTPPEWFMKTIHYTLSCWIIMVAWRWLALCAGLLLVSCCVVDSWAWKFICSVVCGKSESTPGLRGTTQEEVVETTHHSCHNTVVWGWARATMVSHLVWSSPLFVPSCQLLRESTLEGCRWRLNKLPHNFNKKWSRWKQKGSDQIRLAEPVRAINRNDTPSLIDWKGLGRPKGFTDNEEDFQQCLKKARSVLCFSDQRVWDHVGVVSWTNHGNHYGARWVRAHANYEMLSDVCRTWSLCCSSCTQHLWLSRVMRRMTLSPTRGTTR